MVIRLLLVLPRHLDIGDQLLIELVYPLGVVLHFSDDLLEQDVAITFSKHRVDHLFGIDVVCDVILLAWPGHVAHSCVDELAPQVADFCFLLSLCWFAVSALHRSFMH